MKKIRHDNYRIALERKAEELRHSLGRRIPIVVEPVSEKVEEMFLAAERESVTRELERTSHLLRQVEAALSRIQSGKYGSCLRCESPIPAKRLSAVPWAMYCVDCQELDDGLHKRVNGFRMPAA